MTGTIGDMVPAIHRRIDAEVPLLAQTDFRSLPANVAQAMLVEELHAAGMYEIIIRIIFIASQSNSTAFASALRPVGAMRAGMRIIRPTTASRSCAPFGIRLAPRPGKPCGLGSERN